MFQLKTFDLTLRRKQKNRNLGQIVYLETATVDFIHPFMVFPYLTFTRDIAAERKAVDRPPEGIVPSRSLNLQ